MTPVRYWDRLGAATQAVLRDARQQLERIEQDPYEAIVARRAVIWNGHYQPNGR